MNAYVVADFLMDLIHKEALPLSVGLINIECENKVIDEESKKSLLRKIPRKKSAQKEKNILVVNQISVLIFPVTTDARDFHACLKGSIIIDPYNDFICEGRDFYSSYLPKLSFPREDLFSTHISFLEDIGTDFQGRTI